MINEYTFVSDYCSNFHFKLGRSKKKSIIISSTQSERQLESIERMTAIHWAIGA